MEYLVFAIIFLLVLIPIVLGSLIPIYKKHFKVTGNIINYDTMMQRFIYKVYMSEEEIINALKEQYETDELFCEFDFDKTIIKISQYYGETLEYFFEIKVLDEYSILKLNRVTLIGMKSDIPFKLNPFFVKKLNAELIPYAQYET